MDYRSIIESRYNRQSWQELLYDIFRQKVQFWQQPQLVSVDESMAKRALFTGKITLPDGHIIAIYEVELSDSVIIERNRAGIRNLLCTNWRGMGCSGAFMFCFRQNEAVLRFSYVSEAFTFTEDGGIKKESTDTKRFTYLLGEGHRSRTAIQQFEKLKASGLTLKDVTKAFSVEALSKMFFDEYKKQYEDIIEFITGKRMVKVANKWEERVTGQPCSEIMQEFAKFEDAEKAVRDYVKKLMGRLVFIQFLQKKGWMGCSAGEAWDDGDREFVQNLFANTQHKNTFVDDVLEPLFNDLNTKRYGDLVTNQNIGRNVKVPYLNGGLFENDDYDSTKFPLPARYMESMLDFFASYNFTIDENDPNDAEIGVDPEMLGRIFENLLEDNKDKGAFYTPKEIVQYMCRESLIAYLTTCVMKKQGENHKPENEIRDAVRKLLAEPETIVPKMSKEHLEDFGRYIREVKICDPAIGSGAFPMGLLNELVRCRVTINAWAKDAYGNILIGDYAALKADIICNNIYGVDIEKGAIDIARLRFWLSIIVNLNIPHALPNFDYKFMQGNSLITTFNGEYVNLDTKNQQHIKVADMKEEKQKLYGFKQQYYSAQGNRKHELTVEIKKSILRLISMQIGYELRSWYNKNIVQTTLSFDGEANNVSFNEIKSQLPQEKQTLVNRAEDLYKKLNDTNVDIAKRALIDINFFDWRIMFTEVFEGDNGGFDIVIGNPPYFVYEGKNKGEIATLKKIKDFKIAMGGKLNAYKLFLAHALNCLVKKSGINCFIFQNSFMADLQATNLREYTLSNCQILSIDSFPERDSKKKRVFESVKMSVCIVVIRNIKGKNPFIVNIWDDRDKTSGTNTTFSKSEIDAIDKEGHTIPRISEEMKPIIIKMLKHKKINIKCNEGELNVTSHRSYFSTDNSLPVIMKGAGIQRYYHTFNMSQGSIEYLREDEYLRDLGASDKAQHHYSRRIVMQGMTGANDKIRLVMTIVPEGMYLGHSCKYIMPNDELPLECILAIMNSKIANAFFRCFSTNSNVNGYEVENIPIPKIPKEIQTELTEKVSHILLAKQKDIYSNTSAEEREIDRLVYALYGLTEDEIAIVEGTE